jgi:hypothetical protein
MRVVDVVFKMAVGSDPLDCQKDTREYGKMERNGKRSL